MKDLWQLFMVFFRMGAVTFGGGYAMLPIMQKEIVEKRNWTTNEEIIDYYALSQCVPGIIAVNTAILIGHKQKGLMGGIFAALGMVSPSIIVITTIAAFFKQFQDYAVVQHAFGGIRVVVVALIAEAIIKMWRQSVKNWLGIGIFSATSILILFARISPIYIIVLSAFIGIARTKAFHAISK